MIADRVGLGWRPELAAGVLAHLEHVDVVEVIADDHFDAPRRRLRALRTLAAQVPVTLHGVGLGAASREPVDARRLERLARLVNTVEPESWSEHLAFVRGGGREIGHLAAPPRVPATVAGAAENLERARRVVGSLPLVENVATLVEPPGSVQAEDEWLADVLAASGAGLLLDLHNLHANAVNFGFDARAFLDRLPAECIAAVHLAGGRWIRAPAGAAPRLLDDHLHDVPEPVFDLLEEVARRAPCPLTVILERDGAYPSMQALLGQLDRARAALRAGRERRAAEPPPSVAVPARPSAGPGPAAPTEAFLARLYTDPVLRERFLADPAAEAGRLGLAREAEVWGRLDRPGLHLAAESFARKRAWKAAGRAGRTVPERLAELLGRLAR